MMRRRQWLIALALLAVASSVIILRTSFAKPDDLTQRLTGEWKLIGNEMEIVWSFKATGIVRLDVSSERHRTSLTMPMVGRWRLDGDEVVCTLEVWNDKYNRAVETEERLRVRTINDKELTLVVVAQLGKRVKDGKVLQYQRFPGWPPMSSDQSATALDRILSLVPQIPLSR